MAQSPRDFLTSREKLVNSIVDEFMQLISVPDEHREVSIETFLDGKLALHGRSIMGMVIPSLLERMLKD